MRKTTQKNFSNMAHDDSILHIPSTSSIKKKKKNLIRRTLPLIFLLYIFFIFHCQIVCMFLFPLLSFSNVNLNFFFHFVTNNEELKAGKKIMRSEVVFLNKSRRILHILLFSLFSLNIKCLITIISYNWFAALAHLLFKHVDEIFFLWFYVWARL